MPSQVKKHAKRLPDVVEEVDVVADLHVSVPDQPSAMTSLYILVLASQVALVEATAFCLT